MTRRHLLLCAEDSSAASPACAWLVDNVWRPGPDGDPDAGDMVHIVFVVKCLMPNMEVFHGLPGTSYSFQQPHDTHREQKLIQAAKDKLNARLLPALRKREVPYQMHLYAERVEAPASRVAELILQCAEDRDAALVVVAAHNQPGGRTDFTGSVAEAVIKNCKRPLAIYRPQEGPAGGA